MDIKEVFKNWIEMEVKKAGRKDIFIKYDHGGIIGFLNYKDIKSFDSNIQVAPYKDDWRIYNTLTGETYFIGVI